jgi:ATP-dependent DNA helicase RecQ
VITGFDRPNLAYESRRASKVAEKDRLLIDLLRQELGSGIIYCSTRRAVDEVTAMLSEDLKDRSIFAYHAGMDQAARASNQERFMTTPRAVAVATNAFGMGINKPDIRFVVHYNVPGTLEAYYQEAGRAGRDGQLARCIVLFSFQDKFTQEFFIDKIGEDGNLDPRLVKELQDRARNKLELVLKYAQTHRCRRQMILDYFGDEAEVINCQCDVCRRGEIGAVGVPTVMPDEVTLLVRQLLSGVARLRGRFGVGVVAEVLAGVTNEKTARWGFDQLSVFGLLRIYAVKRIVAMLHRLIEAGLARQRDPDRNFRPILELTPAGIAVMKSEQPPPAPLVDLLPRGSHQSVTSPRVRSQKIGTETFEEEQLDPDVLARFERLRNARLELARDRQLPPYCICHDRTLKLIARHAPRDAETLEQIKGMGPHKVRMYGEKFLGAIQDT